MEEEFFQFDIAPFKIPENGQPLFQLGEFIFEWDQEKTQIVIGELNHDLYFELLAKTSHTQKAIDAKLLQDYKDAGEVSIKFSLTHIFNHYIPTGSTNFYDGKSEDYQYFQIEGLDFPLQFSGTVTCENGWVGINGYLKASYEEEQVFTVKIYQKINTENLNWDHYHFLSLEETATANPEIVRRLTIKNPSFESLPEEVFNFKNLEMLTILNHSPNFEQTGKLPLKSIDERIAELAKLKAIQIYNAKINSLPKSLGQLKNLEFLGVNLCNLTEIPAEVWQLPNLNTIYLQQNKITEIPEDVHLKNLVYMDVSGNPLKTLPVGLLKSKILASISANNCALEYLPQEFSDVKGLDIEF